ncbi:hypothetical protein CXU22_04450 [Akkermansia muciniphila]|uniref:Uncharacterized protein n=1 Tax=Akkermansia muciniphila TaxID=239935 RepID=A0A2N8HFI7_9BACT|nr:hypothetical protein CXU22_04450 [Akkermansia muciniphila]
MKLFFSEFPQVFTGAGMSLFRETVFPQGEHRPSLPACRRSFPEAFNIHAIPAFSPVTYAEQPFRGYSRNGCSYEKEKPV